MLHPRNKKKNNGKRGLDDINLKDYNKNLFQDRIHCTPKTCGFLVFYIETRLKPVNCSQSKFDKYQFHHNCDIFSPDYSKL